MKNAAPILHRLFILAALTIALAASGFAQRLPSADERAMQAFVSAGGNLADLCLGGSADDLPDHRTCKACCNVVGAGLLPVVPAIQADLVFVHVAAVVAPRESRAVRDVLDPARGTRAPPLA